MDASTLSRGLAACALALALGACGGDDDPDAASAAPATAPITGADPATPGAGGRPGDDPPGAGGVGDGPQDGGAIGGGPGGGEPIPFGSGGEVLDPDTDGFEPAANPFAPVLDPQAGAQVDGEVDGEAGGSGGAVDPDVGDDAALLAALRTAYEAPDDYELWSCSGGAPGANVGYAFDTDTLGVYLGVSPEGESFALSFDYETTGSDAVRLDYSESGPDLREDITDIVFTGPDLWTGASSTDGELDCLRIVVSPEDGSGQPEETGEPEPPSPPSVEGGEGGVSPLLARLDNDFVDGLFRNSWFCTAGDAETFLGFAFADVVNVYVSVEAGAEPESILVSALQIAEDAIELDGPGLDAPVRIEDIAFANDDLFGARSSVDGQIACQRLSQ